MSQNTDYEKEGIRITVLGVKGHKHFCNSCCTKLGFPGGAIGKEPPASAGDIRDVGLIPGLGRSCGGGHSNPLQCSCLENPIDMAAWHTMVHRVEKSWTQLKQLSSHACITEVLCFTPGTNTTL